MFYITFSAIKHSTR